TPESIYDRCERPGDRLRVGDGGREVEIGWLEYIPGELEDGATPDAESPGLHFYLADAVDSERDDFYGTVHLIRTFVTEDRKVTDLPYFSFETRYVQLDGGSHLFGRVRNYQSTQVQELLTVGVVQGDANHNGIFGAREDDPVAMIAAGRPEESYLVARLRGTMFDEEVPGSRMPLANQPLSIAEMLALFCFIEGLPADPSAINMASSIDYAGCSYSAAPEELNLLGSGVTWSQRIKQILEFNCGGCHSDPAPQAALNLKGEDVYARLLESSAQLPDLKLIEPGVPEQSYLWLKLVADESIVGAGMPLNPLSGAGMLSEAELADIRAWIEAGAVEDQ
ncbi:MAG: hypothetical protein OEZ06_27430, partial [Myxococcales bacterium]|nr:hypothetical protein [Myxococcales bacterium]